MLNYVLLIITIIAALAVWEILAKILKNYNIILNYIEKVTKLTSKELDYSKEISNNVIAVEKIDDVIEWLAIWNIIIISTILFLLIKVKLYAETNDLLYFKFSNVKDDYKNQFNSSMESIKEHIEHISVMMADINNLKNENLNTRYAINNTILETNKIIETINGRIKDCYDRSEFLMNENRIKITKALEDLAKDVVNLYETNINKIKLAQNKQTEKAFNIILGTIKEDESIIFKSNDEFLKTSRKTFEKLSDNSQNILLGACVLSTFALTTEYATEINNAIHLASQNIESLSLFENKFNPIKLGNENRDLKKIWDLAKENIKTLEDKFEFNNIIDFNENLSVIEENNSHRLSQLNRQLSE